MMASSRYPGVNVQMRVNIKTDGPGEVLFTTGYNTAGIHPYLQMGESQPAIGERGESRQQTPTEIAETPGPQIQLLEASGDDLKPHLTTDKEESITGESLKGSKKHHHHHRHDREKNDRQKKYLGRSNDKEKRHHHQSSNVKSYEGETESSTLSTISTDIRTRRSRQKYTHHNGEDSSTPVDVPIGLSRLPHDFDSPKMGPTVTTTTTDDDEILFNRELTKPPVDHDAIMMPSGPFTIPLSFDANNNSNPLRYPMPRAPSGSQIVKPKTVDVSMETVPMPKQRLNDISLQTDIKVVRTVREQKIQTDEQVAPPPVIPEPQPTATPIVTRDFQADFDRIPADLPRSLNAFAGAFQALLVGIKQDVSQVLSARNSMPDLNGSLQEVPTSCSSLSGSKPDIRTEKITTFSAEPEDFEESMPQKSGALRSRESLISNRNSTGNFMPVETEERGTSPLPENAPIHEMTLLMEETREADCQTESFPQPPPEAFSNVYKILPKLPPRPTNWQPTLRYEGEHEYEVPRPSFGPGSPGYSSHYENIQPAVTSSPTKSNSTDTNGKRPIKGILKSPVRETTFPVSFESYENPFLGVNTEMIDPILHLNGSPRSSAAIPQSRPAVPPPKPPMTTGTAQFPSPMATNKQRRDEFFGITMTLPEAAESTPPENVNSYQHLPVSSNYRVSEPESNYSTSSSSSETTETSGSTAKDEEFSEFPAPSSNDNSQESILLPEPPQSVSDPLVETVRSSITPVLIIPPPPSQIQIINQLPGRISPARSATPTDKRGMTSAKIYEIYTKPSLFKPQSISPQFPTPIRISTPSINSERSSISSKALKQGNILNAASISLVDDNSSLYNEIKGSSTGSGTIGAGGSRASTVDSVVSDVSLKTDLSKPYAAMTVGQIDPILKTSTTSTTSTSSKTVKFNNLNYDSKKVMIVEETIEETIESYHRPNTIEKYFSGQGDPIEFMSDSGTSINDVGSDIHPITPDRQAVNKWLNGSVCSGSIMEENLNDYAQGDLSGLGKFDDLESLTETDDQATISRNAATMRTDSISRYAQVIKHQRSLDQPIIAKASTIRVEHNKNSKPPITQTDL